MKSFFTFLENIGEREAADREAAYGKFRAAAKKGAEQMSMADKKRKEEERRKRIEELKKKMRMKGIEYDERDLV